MSAFSAAAQDEDGDEIKQLRAENETLRALLRDAEYALDYASDMTKPEGLSGCDCPICTVSDKLRNFNDFGTATGETK